MVKEIPENFLKEPPLNKVDQMDAHLIDEQSKMLLKSTLVAVFPQQWVIKRSHEIQLLLDFLFFRFTTARGIQTPGQRLQNLKFAFKTKAQMLALFLLQVLVPYLVSKAQDFLARANWGNAENMRRGTSVMRKIKYIIAKLFQISIQAARFAELINFLGFMSQSEDNSVYRRNISETFLQVNLARNDPQQTQRSLSFEYVNIRVVWTAVGRSLAYLLPFLDFSKVKQMLLGGSATLTQTISFSSPGDDAAAQGSLCAICGTTNICMPYQALPCKCVFCYYCLQSKLQEK